MQQTQTTIAQSPQMQVGGIHPKVAELDFERLKWKLAHSSEAKMSPEMCDLAEREYRRFLTLKLMHPKVSLVPSKLQDKFWHAHILDTAAYARDCETLFGHFMHHFPYFGIYGEDDKRALDDSFAKTTALYESLFGESQPKFGAAECNDCTDRCKCNGDVDKDRGEMSAAARCDTDKPQPKCETKRCYTPQSTASRCAEHPCHVPTSCACREPGTCK